MMTVLYLSYGFCLDVIFQKYASRASNEWTGTVSTFFLVPSDSRPPSILSTRAGPKSGWSAHVAARIVLPTPGGPQMTAFKVGFLTSTGTGSGTATSTGGGALSVG